MLSRYQKPIILSMRCVPAFDILQRRYDPFTRSSDEKGRPYGYLPSCGGSSRCRLASRPLYLPLGKRRRHPSGVCPKTGTVRQQSRRQGFAASSRTQNRAARTRLRAARHDDDIAPGPARLNFARTGIIPTRGACAAGPGRAACGRGAGAGGKIANDLFKDDIAHATSPTRNWPSRKSFFPSQRPRMTIRRAGSSSSMARDQAVDAVDARFALEAIGQMDGHIRIDALAMDADVVTRIFARQRHRLN